MFEHMSGCPYWREKQICDFCGQPKIYSLAEELCEPGVMENGCWTEGKHTPEKSDKWKVALKKAHDQLKKHCLVFDTVDCDGGTVCRDCLEKFLKEYSNE